MSDIIESYPSIRWYYAKNSYLRQKGWVASERVGAPVDGEGNPSPWYTYPAIDFVEPRLDPTFRVFEFGSGHSSLWYSKRVEEVVAVEDSKGWAENMKQRSPENLKIVHQPDVAEYPQEIKDRGEFDIVVIDGRDRLRCVKPATESVNDDGVIVLDDFERWDYEDWEPLRSDGFRQISFHGPKAQRLTESCTAVLYRDRNCLSI